MNKKGAGKRELLLVALAVFISTNVFGEGENVVGYEAAGAQVVFFNSELSGTDLSDSEPRSVERARPPLAMTTALKLDDPLGAYLRFGLASKKGISPYLVTGVSRWTRSDLDLAAGNANDSDGDISYGIGADFNLAEDAKINVEYLDYIDGSDEEASGFSFGASWTF